LGNVEPLDVVFHGCLLRLGLLDPSNDVSDVALLKGLGVSAIMTRYRHGAAWNLRVNASRMASLAAIPLLDEYGIAKVGFELTNLARHVAPSGSTVVALGEPVQPETGVFPRRLGMMSATGMIIRRLIDLA
jgi:hypothetical protein